MRMELPFHPGPAGMLSSNLYDIFQCQEYSELTPDDGQRNCPKHVEVHFLAKKIIWEISASVGFIIKTYVWIGPLKCFRSALITS
jgi:hypothetical protein